MIIYRLLWYIAFVADLSVLLIIYYTYDGIKDFIKGYRYSFNEWVDKIGNDINGLAGKYTTIIMVISTIAMIITNTAMHQLVGVNDLRLKPTGTYCFYVEATKYGGKTYTLPAQIRIETEIEEVSENSSRTYRYYFVDKVIFSNGGYLNTENMESIEINDRSRFYDNNDDEWELVLLNKHAYSPYVVETNNATWLDLMFLMIRVISIFIVFYSMYRHNTNSKE